MTATPPVSRPRQKVPIFRVATATDRDREAIYRLRHAVYARELQQHPENHEGRLVDPLDGFNHYLCAWHQGELAGFVSMTPPGPGRYSIDKYFSRAELPFPCDGHLFEVRILTVLPSARGSKAALLLMYAALRWVEARGGTRIAAIGRREVLGLYAKAGLRGTGQCVQSGKVEFELLHATTEELRVRADQFAQLLDRLEAATHWDLDVDFRRPAACFHGGSFFKAVGEDFARLDRHHDIINADVLDAWFPPSPRVLDALQSHLPWLLRTSPPTAAEGLVDAIADARGVRPGNILPGAGSSDLIFRALRHWLDRHSRVLILDPTYGEYGHVLERVIGCAVDRLTLSASDGYGVPVDRLSTALGRGYDLVVLVNPNSPTGRHLPRVALEQVLEAVPAETRIWIDETYLDYVGAAESLESRAASSDNIIVCKSMSKVYALSGARVAYLCAAPQQLEALRALTPPWGVSLLAQVAAVNALRDPDYYAARMDQTHTLREDLAVDLKSLGWEVLPGCANFLLVHLPASGPTAAGLVRRCQESGLFIRDASTMSRQFGSRVVRVAVKDAATNRRMVSIIRAVLTGAGVAPSASEGG